MNLTRITDHVTSPSV